MSYRHILRNTWASSPAILDDDTYLLSEVIYGHLMYHLSTPTSFLTWDENTPRRIQCLLKKIAVHHPRVPPTAALRAMLVVLAFKRDNRNIVAFHNDAEILFMTAFRAIAANYDASLSHTAFDDLTYGRYLRSKMAEYPHILDEQLKDALAKDSKTRYDANAHAVLEHFLSLYVPGEVGRLEPECSRYPFMPAFERPGGARAPSARMQRPVFPDSAHLPAMFETTKGHLSEHAQRPVPSTSLEAPSMTSYSKGSLSNDSSSPSTILSSVTSANEQAATPRHERIGDICDALSQETRDIPIVGEPSYERYVAESAGGRLNLRQAGLPSLTLPPICRVSLPSISFNLSKRRLRSFASMSLK